MKTVIWDMGGVIIRTENQALRRAWEKRLGLEQDQLHDLVFGSELSRAASIGKATEEDIWTSIQQQLSLTETDLQQLRRDFFSADTVDQKLMEYIHSLKAHHTVGMITNAWPGIRKQLTDVWKIADAFEKIIVSAEVGLIKPHAAIYHLALEELNTSAEDAVFIDDFIQNVNGARAAGMHAVHFTGRDQTIAELNAILS